MRNIILAYLNCLKNPKTKCVVVIIAKLAVQDSLLA